jgi:hypothetical protein
MAFSDEWLAALSGNTRYPCKSSYLLLSVLNLSLTVSFPSDVTSTSSAIILNVYDRNNETSVGFLGTIQVKHPFNDGATMDRWFKYVLT